ncbi:Hypothetical_protein [Hexamita inflata]|uniref:Hypothetical_protein n=1 Tax=Hexamita inflata TaxID=28002 RepID=A0AA86R0C3_9EUKA|nr:Hypothetical protein HINF_LOCUS52226 [Hexamita inflata]
MQWRLRGVSQKDASVARVFEVISKWLEFILQKYIKAFRIRVANAHVVQVSEHFPHPTMSIPDATDAVVAYRMNCRLNQRMYSIKHSYQVLQRNIFSITLIHKFTSLLYKT